MKGKVLAIVLLISAATGAGSQPFTLVSANTQASVYVDSGSPEFVSLAVADLIDDVAEITGRTITIVPRFSDCKGNCVVVGSVDKPGFGKLLSRLAADTSKLAGRSESFRIQSLADKKRDVLIIAGSDDRGAMFGIYHFCKTYLGVDPLGYWSGTQPRKRSELKWNDLAFFQHEPEFRYRGWFINDEDLLTEFVEGGGTRDIDYPFYKQVVHPDAFEPVVESLVRSGFNLIIPASFIDIRNPAERRLVEVASRRGVFLSQHHVEPLGVSAFTFFNYWRAKGKSPKFSFYSSRKELEEVWRVYAAEWAKFPNVIWQIGLRGIADRPMWMADPDVPQSDADRGGLISEAMQVQMDIVRSVSAHPPVVTSTLWAEGAGLFEEGHITFPRGTIIVFSDNSPGWKWQPDFYKTSRKPDQHYGVYYHHQLWGSGPHLAQAVPPSQTHRMFRDASEKSSAHYAIMNVSNVREFVLGIETSSKLLWDLSQCEGQDLLGQWVRMRFSDHQEAVTNAYKAYFDSFQLHPGTQSPFTLDGQIRGYGRRIIDELKALRSGKGVAEGKKPETKSVEATWGKRFLSDMHPEAGMPPAEYESALMAQREHLDRALNLAQDAARRLTGDEKAFLESNLLGHVLIMRGLNHWCLRLIEARAACEAGDAVRCRQSVDDALAGFEQLEAGQKFNTRGKWAHWYRGERKMNLADLRKQTLALTGQMK